MSFNNNVPQPGDFLSDSQQDILNNFSALDTSFNINHYAFSDTTANNGKHTFVQMPDQTVIPATADNEIQIYSKDVSGNSRLFLKQEGDGTEIQMSGKDPIIADPGRTFLPGGMLLIFGSVPPAVGSTAITFPDSGFPNNCFSVTTGGGGGVQVSGVSKTGFSMASHSGVTAYYMAIGN